MENSVAALTDETEKQLDKEATREATPGTDHVQSPASEAIPEDARLIIRSLIERYQLTREQLAAIYEECVSLNSVAAAAAAPTVNHSAVDSPGSAIPSSSPNVIIVTGEGGLGAEGGVGVGEQVSIMETGLSEGGGQEEGGRAKAGEEEQFGMEIGKMQTLVHSALQSYETSPAASELGSKRKLFSLEEELNMRPTMFAQELLDRDQTLVAQAIKKYMNQYSIPQREVVEKTGLNQSHLSQHFLHGVTMKRSKRVKLYHWFEDDQQARTGRLMSADGSISSVLESPKVEGSRRRPRWKWSPISTQILTEAFKKNHFPTREQRLELGRVCHEAEIAMNNGMPIRGPEGDTEGITEQRVNTWFTNRRKGLLTPSPTRGEQDDSGSSLPTSATAASSGSLFTPGSGGAVFTPGLPLPQFLRPTTPISTPSTPAHATIVSTDDRGTHSIIPTNVQTLVNQIHQASQPQVQLTPTQTVPFAIALSGGATTVLSPAVGSSVTSPCLQPSSTTPLTEATPTIISSAHLQALFSQLQAASAPSHLQLPTPSSTLPSIITIPAGAAMLNSSPTSTPTPMHTITVADSPLKVTDPTAASAIKAFGEHQILGTIPTLAPNQVQALLAQLHSQAKVQGTPQLQINPGSAVPLAITLPGVSNEDLAKAIMLTNQQGTSQ